MVYLAIPNLYEDEDYISFMESLKDTQTKTFDADTLEALGMNDNFHHWTQSNPPLVASTQPAPAPTSTPLLEALKAEKSAQKDKEAIQRNHAHYKDPIVASGLAPPVGGSKKEDTRKRSSGAPPPSKATETQPSKKVSKKAAAAAKAPNKRPKPREALLLLGRVDSHQVPVNLPQSLLHLPRRNLVEDTVIDRLQNLSQSQYPHLPRSPLRTLPSLHRRHPRQHHWQLLLPPPHRLLVARDQCLAWAHVNLKLH